MIRLDGVSKRFGVVSALKDVSFELHGPGVVGLLGPNGSGKTTTMRLVTGYLMPTSGQVTVLGHDMRRNSMGARREIGYLPENPPLYREMTGRSYLEFVGTLRGLSRRVARRQVDVVAEQCGILSRLPIELGKLSRGQRQRFGLAQALLHDPKVLVLDEPTAGIDPEQVVETRQLIANLGRDRLVLLSTHILTEVSTLCSSVVFIKNGRLVAHDTVERLTARPLSRQIRLRLLEQSDDVARRLAALPGVEEVRIDHQDYVLDVAPQAAPAKAIARLVADADWSLVAYHTASASLEDAYLELSSGDIDL